MSNIKDVAKLAGVSPSTVSRVLSESAFVEEKTKKKVLDAVTALNYMPDALARGLRKGRVNTIALMTPFKTGVFWPIAIEAAEFSAQKRGFSLLLGNSGTSVESELKMLRTLSAQSVSGIICMTTMIDVERYAAFQKESGIPVVVVNRNSHGLISSVSVDDDYLGYALAKYLLERGHRKIACFFGDSQWDKVYARFRGVCRAMEAYDTQEYVPYVCFNVTDIDKAEQRAAELLDRKDPPTAFLSTVDSMSAGVYRAIRKRGLRVPEDVSMLGVDNNFIVKYCVPNLTTYMASMEELMDKSMEIVMRGIQGDDTVQELALQGSFVERGSVADLQAKL